MTNQNHTLMLFQAGSSLLLLLITAIYVTFVTSFIVSAPLAEMRLVNVETAGIFAGEPNELSVEAYANNTKVIFTYNADIGLWSGFVASKNIDNSWSISERLSDRGKKFSTYSLTYLEIQKDQYQRCVFTTSPSLLCQAESFLAGFRYEPFGALEVLAIKLPYLLNS